MTSSIKTSNPKAMLDRRAPARLVRILLWPLVLLLWEMLVRAMDVPTYIVPAPSGIVGSFAENRSEILSNSWVTIQEIGLGLALATVCALLAGLAIHASRLLRSAFYPLMVVAQTSPKEALAPLLIIWFGYTMQPKIIMAAVIAFFPILIATTTGLDRFDGQLRNLARSMGATPTKTLVSFRVWAAMPSIFGGLRVGITLATVGAVIGEFLGSDVGIGFLVLTASRRLDGDLLFASLIILVALTLLLIGALDRLEGRLLPHRQQTGFPQ